MQEVLRFENLKAAGSAQAFSGAVERGTSAAILSREDQTRAVLARVILGVRQPVEGSVFLFGVDVGRLREKELLALRRRVGVVYAGGGLLSNLKAWENLVLPLSYHTDASASELEERGRAVLERLGYGGRLMAAPAELGRFDRLLVGLGRAMLLDPELMLYEFPFEVLAPGERRRLLDAARAFQAERPERTSLFLTSHAESLSAIGGEKVFHA